MICLPDLMKLLKQIWKFHLPVALKSIIFIYMHACIMFMKIRGRLNWIIFLLSGLHVVLLSCSACNSTHLGIWFDKYDIDTKKNVDSYDCVYIFNGRQYSIFKSCLKKRWVRILIFFFSALWFKKKNHWMMSLVFVLF